MATEAQLVDALTKADAAGDHQSAQQFAGMIRDMRSSPQPPPPSPSPEQAGVAEGRSAGMVQAFSHQALEQSTFGLMNYADGLIKSAGQVLSGQRPTFSDNVAYARGMSEGEMESYPVSGTVGGVVGGTLGAGKVIKGVAALTRLGKVADVIGKPLANAGPITRTLAQAGTNAAIGTGVSKAEGQDTPTALEQGGLAAIAGTTASKAIDWGLDKIGTPGTMAFKLLAKTLGEAPDDLEKAYDSFLKLTGSHPSMGQLVTIKSRGQLRALAQANPEIAAAADKASQASSMPFHEQIAQAQTATRPQTESAMKALRDNSMTAALGAKDPATGVAIRDTRVPVVGKAKAVLEDPTIISALRENTKQLDPTSQFSDGPTVEKIANNDITIKDLDVIRRALRDRQDNFSQPGSASTEIAKSYGRAAEAVEGLATSASPQYARLMQRYRAASDYTRAFAHGVDGGSATDLPEGDAQLAKSLGRPIGQKGYEHGRAVRVGQEALEAIAPSTVSPTASVPTSTQVVHGTVAAVAHSGPSGAYHIARALLSGGAAPRLSPAAQKIVADQLFSKDPGVVQQAFANLRRAGASADALRSLTTAIGIGATVNAAAQQSNNGQSLIGQARGLAQ